MTIGGWDRGRGTSEERKEGRKVKGGIGGKGTHLGRLVKLLERYNKNRREEGEGRRGYR